jgi:hypothetical protein
MKRLLALILVLSLLGGCSTYNTGLVLKCLGKAVNDEDCTTQYAPRPPVPPIPPTTPMPTLPPPPAPGTPGGVYCPGCVPPHLA